CCWCVESFMRRAPGLSAVVSRARALRKPCATMPRMHAVEPTDPHSALLPASVLAGRLDVLGTWRQTMEQRLAELTRFLSERVLLDVTSPEQLSNALLEVMRTNWVSVERARELGLWDD